MRSPKSANSLSCILAILSYIEIVKTLTIRLPDSLLKRLEIESQSRCVSKSDIVRERLAALPPPRQNHPLA